MLMKGEEGAVSQSAAIPLSGSHATSEERSTLAESSTRRSPLARAMRVEWLGQTIASICWIASVFVYGISSTGDWLQLFAASAWLVANVASFATAEAG